MQPEVLPVTAGWVGHYLLDVQGLPSEEHCYILEKITRPEQKILWEWKREVWVHDKKSKNSAVVPGIE